MNEETKKIVNILNEIGIGCIYENHVSIEMYMNDIHIGSYYFEDKCICSDFIRKFDYQIMSLSKFIKLVKLRCFI